MNRVIDAGVFKSTKDFLNHFENKRRKLKERCQVTLQRKEINNGENSKHQ
tara:strand:+ start:565 stop:714 length:150 start_codon:yes stop_codon:yes gene_type:complete